MSKRRAGEVSFARLLRLAFWSSRLWLAVPVSLIFIAVPVATNWYRLYTTIMRDNFDIVAILLSAGPSILLAPLFAVLIGCVPVYLELGRRHVANVRTRTSIRSYVASKIVIGSILVFAAFFASAFVAYLVAYVVWPSLGNPSIDPGIYFLSPDEAKVEALSRSSYSQLLAYSPLVWALAYSAWVGFAGVVFAGLGFGALVFLKNRALAMALPLIVYIVQTLFAALLGFPQFGLLYSVWPFGLSQTSLFEASAATLVLAVLVLVGWAWLWRRLPHLDRLA